MRDGVSPQRPIGHPELPHCICCFKPVPYIPRLPFSADFLNGVCSKIYHLTVRSTLDLYGGNYDSYVRTRQENEVGCRLVISRGSLAVAPLILTIVRPDPHLLDAHQVNQLKRYEKEQEDIKHLKEFISSCGTYSNLVKQAQSKQKIIDKMVEAGLTLKPVPDPVFRFSFPSSEKIPPPVLAFQNVSFAYSGKPEDYLYTNLEFGIDCDSRIALVGPNGAGKSTLLKLMLQEIEPQEGEVRRNPHLRIGRYNQHSEDVLDLEATPLDFMQVRDSSYRHADIVGCHNSSPRGEVRRLTLHATF